MPDVNPRSSAATPPVRAGRVSVVVPTRNSARTLPACLSSIRNQDVSDIELIVVDNGSTDGTVDIATEVADVVVDEGPERSAQRNRGIELAGGEWVMWVDADMVLDPSCIRVARDLAIAARVDAVAVPEVTVGHGFWTACRALERSCYVDDPALHNARFVRRTVLSGLGGFDESMSGPEDSHLRHRLRAAGVGVALTPVLIEHDEGRLTVRDVVRKRVYYGRSLPAFATTNPGKVREQGLATLRAFRRHRRRLMRSPGLAAGMLALRLLESAAYGVGAWQGRRASSSNSARR